MLPSAHADTARKWPASNAEGASSGHVVGRCLGGATVSRLRRHRARRGHAHDVRSAGCRGKTMNAEAQLKAFVAKFDPKDQRLIRAVRQAAAQTFPGGPRTGLRQLQLLRHRLLADRTAVRRHCLDRRPRKQCQPCASFTAPRFPIRRKCCKAPAIRRASFVSSQPACWRVRKSRRLSRSPSRGRRRRCQRRGAEHSSSGRCPASSVRAGRPTTGRPNPRVQTQTRFRQASRGRPCVP